eukprot:CAMPEP_0117419404 /NCGR_PEP_ID=MMETSP0758-20121206/967_1 /TAXON_ID=63605 /ORGANISM="Percolomonas cosmopolitus, Strain AE-1 (ATCC 50343)" /LENGTH=271 /DNA_ID=CAMNT_0005200437 /DNA_START=194 /DNA_END=1009 /DNA_ORIENTATION=+
MVHARKKKAHAKNHQLILTFLLELQTFYAIHYFASPKVHSPLLVFDAFCDLVPFPITPSQQQDLGEMHDLFVEKLIEGFALLGVNITHHLVMPLKLGTQPQPQSTIMVPLEGNSLASSTKAFMDNEQLSLDNFPSSFAIQLVRVVFDNKGNFQKNRLPVSIETPPFSSSCSIASVVYHVGSNPLTGHYVCAVKQPYDHLSSAPFLYCNDRQVVESESLLTKVSPPVNDLALVVYSTIDTSDIVRFLKTYSHLILDALPSSVHDAIQEILST